MAWHVQTTNSTTNTFFVSLQVAYVFDNEFTVVFAIFMSIWGKSLFVKE